tara:strand:- start:960 stop:1832 length:873 start_codon:yes stop_codon:yes gene_type:complete
VETSWLQELQRNKKPDCEKLLDHLLQIHRDNPGFTEKYSTNCIDSSGKNTYQWLAEVIEREDHREVLDLACGSGPLLSHCHDKFGGNLSLTGVDISKAELNLAEKRLPDTTTLIQAKAQNLEFIRDEEIDVVLCHWALTLMDPVGPVLKEISRVLRPGGTFAAIVDGDKSFSQEYEDVSELIYSWVGKAYQNYGKYELGDVRVRQKETLQELIGHYFREEDITIQQKLFSVFGTPAKLASNVANFFYASYALPENMKPSLLDDLQEYFKNNEKVLNHEFRMPINRLIVRG